MHEDIREQFKKLKNAYDSILPSEEKVEHACTRFLSRIESSQSYGTEVCELSRWRVVVQSIVGLPMLLPNTARVAVRSVGVVVILLFVAFGVGMVTVFAVPGMLPGDALYGVKMATERAQVTLAMSSEHKARLEIEFAGRRVDEAAAIIESGLPDRNERLASTITQFKRHMTQSQSKLETLHVKDQSEAIEVAKIIDRKATEYEAMLLRNGNQGSEEIQEQMRDAQDATQTTAFSAVSVLLDTERSGQFATEELRKKVQEKLWELEDTLQIVGNRLAKVPGGSYPEIEKVNGPSLGSLYQDLGEARESLAKGKDFLVRGGYEESLLHYREGVGISNQLVWAIGLYERTLEERIVAAQVESTPSINESINNNEEQSGADLE